MNVVKKNITLRDGRVIEIETGKLAKQADGSVVVKMGGTMLLATVCCAKEAKEDVDFMPLSVEYKEKFAAAGRYPGGFMKREGRASDYEILIARLIDRALRPLFPDDFHAEVFVTVNLISAEKDIQPDALAGLAASAALAVSDIPFNGPISEVRVARVNGELMINPTFSQMEGADIDIMVAATYDNIMMVEGEMNEVSEKDMLEAIKFAHEEIKIQCQAQMELMQEVGKVEKRSCLLLRQMLCNCQSRYCKTLTFRCFRCTSRRVYANFARRRTRRKGTACSPLLPRCGKRSDASYDPGRRRSFGWS